MFEHPFAVVRDVLDSRQLDKSEVKSIIEKEEVRL